jgi:hypothetical protein
MYGGAVIRSSWSPRPSIMEIMEIMEIEGRTRRLLQTEGLFAPERRRSSLDLAPRRGAQLRGRTDAM